VREAGVPAIIARMKRKSRAQSGTAPDAHLDTTPDTPSDATAGAPSDATPRAPYLRFETITLLAIVVAVAACFWPLTRYFFAQDDFTLLHRAAFSPASAITSFFGDAPGHFRPLSKGAYFVATWRLFGLSAFPYHLVSLLLHAFNTVMVWRMFRRLKAGEAGALTGAALFGLSAGFFHVLAWIACIQQLSGMAFSLVALELGWRAIDRATAGAWDSSVSADASGTSAGAATPHLPPGVSAPALGSLVAWTLALGCVEQAALLPFLFPLYAWAFTPSGLSGVRKALAATAVHWVLLALFAVFILFWKGLPREGVYGFSVGSNVALNLVTYLGWSFDYWMRLPLEMNVYQLKPGWTHLLLGLLVAYHLIRHRRREVVFALGFFLVFTLPVAFLSKHQFYLHTYLPAAGTTYLVALFARDVFDIRPLRSEDARYTTLGVVLVVLVTLSWYSVRANESLLLREGARWRRSFVLRRAITAQNAWVSIRERWKRGVARQVLMVYGREGASDNARWNNLNVVESLGRGRAVELFYGEPRPEVQFLVLDELQDIELDRADLYFYDDHGNCYSLSEFESIRR